MSTPKSQDLVEFLADRLGLPARLIATYGLRLRAADELSKTRGGRWAAGGAPMTSRDAAVWLTAMLASPTALGAVDAVRAAATWRTSGIFIKQFGPAAYTLVPFPVSAEDRAQLDRSFLDWMVGSIDEIRLDLASPPHLWLEAVSVQHQAPLIGAWVDFVTMAPDVGILPGQLVFAPPRSDDSPAAPPIQFERSTTVGANILGQIAAFLGPLPASDRFDVPAAADVNRPCDGIGTRYAQ